MAESVQKKYNQLLEVRLLHHYWLDDGNTCFDLIAAEGKKEKYLEMYDVHSFLEIAPTAATAKMLNSLCCLCRNTALGFMVTVKDGTAIPADTVFEFVVTVRNPDFFNYTALTLRSQAIHELYHQTENTIYRYKENVPVFSNLTGVARGSNPNKNLFLSRQIPQIKPDAVRSSFNVEEFFVLEGDDALYQMTMDRPDVGTGQQQSGMDTDKALDLPVFFNQTDIPELTNPEGLIGVPLRGIRLTDDIPDNVFALIRLSAVRADDDAFSFIDGSGHAKSTYPLYQIRFKSRSAFWKYIEKNNTITLSSKTLPLTFFGNAILTKQKPSQGVVKAVMNDKRVTQLFSEIFV